LLVTGAGAEAVTVEGLVEALPWTMAEELVAVPVVIADAQPTFLSSRALRVLMAALVLVSLFVPFARSSSLFCSRHLVTKDDTVTRFLV